MPMAISLFAAGVIWRVMDQQDPQLGAVNAGIGVVHDAFSPPGPLPDAESSVTKLTGSPKSGFTLQRALHPSSTAQLGLTGISPRPGAEPFTERTPRVVAARKLTRRAEREKAGRFLAEGVNAVGQALMHEGHGRGFVHELFVTPRANHAHAKLVARACEEKAGSFHDTSPE